MSMLYGETRYDRPNYDDEMDFMSEMELIQSMVAGHAEAHGGHMIDPLAGTQVRLLPSPEPDVPADFLVEDALAYIQKTITESFTQEQTAQFWATCSSLDFPDLGGGTEAERMILRFHWAMANHSPLN